KKCCAAFRHGFIAAQSHQPNSKWKWSNNYEKRKSKRFADSKTLRRSRADYFWRRPIVRNAFAPHAHRAGTLQRAGNHDAPGRRSLQRNCSGNRTHHFRRSETFRNAFAPDAHRAGTLRRAANHWRAGHDEWREPCKWKRRRSAHEHTGNGTLIYGYLEMRGGEICRAFFFCNSRLVSAKKLLAAA